MFHCRETFPQMYGIAYNKDILKRFAYNTYRVLHLKHKRL